MGVLTLAIPSRCDTIIDMKLVKENDPILKKKLTPFNFEDPVMDPHELVAGLQAVRKENGGIGLAANQVGIDARVLVIGMGNFETDGVEDFEMAYFNPEVKSLMQGEILMLEGCLSFPDLYIKVKRPQNLVMSWQDADQKQWGERFMGMTSRIIQHELDHLDGITFIERANSFHLEKARKERKLTQRRRKRIDQAI